MSGTLKTGDKQRCILTFSPVESIDLIGQSLKCSIASSKMYTFKLDGRVVPPSVRLSFESFDFGSCFVSSGNALFNSTKLCIINDDLNNSVSIDSEFEESEGFKVKCPVSSIEAGASIDVEILFTPRQEKHYYDKIVFLINGTTKLQAQIKGEGVVPRIELVDSSLQTISLGTLEVGSTSLKTFRLANRTKKAITIDFFDKQNDIFADLGVIVLQGQMTLRSHEIAEISLQFSPIHRQPKFVETLYIRMNSDIPKPLLVLTGCCQGRDIQLDTDALSFGLIYVGSYATKKLLLCNRGDFLAKFKWSVEKLTGDFSILPSEGDVAPHEDRLLEVICHPKKTADYIHLERIPCHIDGYEDLFITLSASATEQPEADAQIIEFSSKVREKTTKQILIKNDSDISWNLTPILKGEHWIVGENLHVPANDKGNFEITFYPLRMTASNTSESSVEYLEGTLFFAIPDGTAILYRLRGKASPPAECGHANLTSACKMPLPVSLDVQNWLRKSQNFIVSKIIEGVAPTIVSCSDRFLLPADGLRQFNIKLYGYKEGKVHITVKFTNPDTNEYLIYIIDVTFTPPEIISTVELETIVRHPIKRTIQIPNPFDQQIYFDDNSVWYKCAYAGVRAKQIDNGSDRGNMEIEFFPYTKISSPLETVLSFLSKDHGEFKYKLILKSLLQIEHTTLYFKAPVGCSANERYSFMSFNKQITEYKCAFQKNPSQFETQPSLKMDATDIWKGTEINLQIKFEPDTLGDISDQLMLQSADGDEYVCILKGCGIQPLPQGPYQFATSQEIVFKNVFREPREFSIAADRPYFVVNPTKLTIPAKTTKTIVVKYDKNENTTEKKENTVNAGKLIITCLSCPDLLPWIYYLEVTK